jgi:hypothetical protein
MPPRAQWRMISGQIIRGIAENWSLEVEPLFPDLSSNFAAPAVRLDGTRRVLKICLPDHEIDAEVLRAIPIPMESVAMWTGFGRMPERVN